MPSLENGGFFDFNVFEDVYLLNCTIYKNHSLSLRKQFG